ncbi:MAG TPA: tetratricopeptide repeat protein [Fulvivirga sp.]|nr:tetratricopeptide repeat protein [Fulvivirga sp.]
MKYYLLALSFLLTQSIFSQEIEDQQRFVIDSLNKIGLDYSISDISKSDSILKSTLKDARNLKYDYGIAMALNNRGEMFLHSGKYDSSLVLVEKAIIIRDKINDLKGLGDSYTIIGEVHRIQGDYEKATENYIKALRFAEDANDKQGLARLKVDIGLVYVAQNKYKEARVNFTKAAEELRELGSINHVADCYNNLAMVCYYEDKYNEAADWLKKALVIYVENNNVKGQAINSTNIGATYSETGKYDEAEKYFLKGLALFRQLKNEVYETTILLNLGDLYRKKKEFIQAEKYLKLSLEKAISLKNREHKKFAYSYLAAVYEETFEYKKSIEYLTLYNNIKDSIINDINTKSISELEAKYQSEAKQRALDEQEKEIALAAAESNKQKIIIWAVSIGLLLIIVFSFIIWNRLRISNTQKQIIQTKNTENELLLGEIHHRVKNNLQVISSLLSLQERNTTDKTTKAAILDGKERVQSMGLIHNMLYQQNNFSGINMSEYIEKLIAGLLDSFGKKPEDFELKYDIKNINLDVDTAIPLGLIINELVVNALKHAYSATKEPKINVGLKEINNQLVLEVEDNGTGEVVDVQSSESFGMKLVNSLSRQLRGTIDIEQRGGLCFKIAINDYKLIP